MSVISKNKVNWLSEAWCKCPNWCRQEVRVLFMQEIYEYSLTSPTSPRVGDREQTIKGTCLKAANEYCS